MEGWLRAQGVHRRRRERPRRWRRWSSSRRGRRGPARARPRGRRHHTPTISGTRRSARARSGASARCSSALRAASAPRSSRRRSCSSTCTPCASRVVSLVLPRRVGEHRDRRGGAGPLPRGRRRRHLARARRCARAARRTAGRRSRCCATGVPFSETDPYFERRPRLLRLLAAVREHALHWSLSSRSFADRRRHLPLRADAEPAVGARLALRVGLRAPAPHGARRRAAARCSRGAIASTCTSLLAGAGPDGAFTYVDHHVVIPVSIWLVASHRSAPRSSSSGRVDRAGAARRRRRSIAVLLVSLAAAARRAAVHARATSTADADAAREASRIRRRAPTTRAAPTRCIASSTRRAYRARRHAPWTQLQRDRRLGPGGTERALGRRRARRRPAGAIEWSASPDGLRPTRRRAPPARRATRATRPLDRRRACYASRADERGIGRARRLRAAARDEPRADRARARRRLAPGTRSSPIRSARSPRPRSMATLSRLAHAWALQNFRLLSADLPRPIARIVDAPRPARATRARRAVLRAGHRHARRSWSATRCTGRRSLLGLRQLSAERSAIRSRRRARHLPAARRVGVVNAPTGATWIVADSDADPIARQLDRARFPRSSRSRSALPDGAAARASAAARRRARAGRKLARYGLRGDSARRGHLARRRRPVATRCSPATSRCSRCPGTGATQWSATCSIERARASGRARGRRRRSRARALAASRAAERALEHHCSISCGARSTPRCPRRAMRAPCTGACAWCRWRRPDRCSSSRSMPGAATAPTLLARRGHRRTRIATAGARSPTHSARAAPARRAQLRRCRRATSARAASSSTRAWRRDAPRRLGRVRPRVRRARRMLAQATP